MQTIVLTGIAGRLGRRLARRLAHDYHVIGVDTRAVQGLPENCTHIQTDLRRRAAEEVFRSHDITAVVHLGVVHNFRISSEQLAGRNIVGTETLLRHASHYGVKKMVLLSTADVYGPMPTNSQFICEDAPLMASQRFPETRSIVAVDRAVQAFFWQHHAIETVILRPAHIVGANVQNAPSKYLRLRIIPTLMGFDPMVQFIGEDDLLEAIVLALQPNVRGVVNVAGCEPVPLSHALALTGKPVLPVPHPLFRAALERAWKYRLTSFPAPELDHIRFNAVLDTQRAHDVLHFKAKYSLDEILAPFQAGHGN